MVAEAAMVSFRLTALGRADFGEVIHIRLHPPR